MVPKYDLIIIGGGIHGVGVAQAAAVAGYSVLVLEKDCWAGATSSRSSKLIHGGLRYLQNGQFGLVRRCLKERALLLRLAPELVWLNEFYIPVYREAKYSRTEIGIGLRLYALLAGENPFYASQLPVKEWADLDGLKPDGLQAVFRYSDAQTDDRLLTLAVKASARAFGCSFSCPAEFSSAQIQNDRVEVKTLCQGDERHFTCRVLVNAAGPWVAQVSSNIYPEQLLVPCELVKGSHLILATRLSDRCFYLEAPDGRIVFVLPWQGQTLVGTTEELFQGDPAQVMPSVGEVTYLLETLQMYFPEADLTLADQFAGVRVLPSGSGKAFFRGRESQIVYDQLQYPRLVSIYGGKLTDYRAVSEQVVNTLKARLGESRSKQTTAQLPLSRELALREAANPFEMI